MANPPTYAETDVNAILSGLIAEYEAQPGAQKVQPASVEMLLFNAISYRLSLYNAKVQYAATQTLVDFAGGPMLDALGELTDTPRLDASAATCTIALTFTASHPGVTLPQGTRVATSNGAAVFTLIAELVVSAGDTSESADFECQTLGTIGNGYTSGQVNRIIDPVANWETASNSTTTAGGAEIETDISYRERIKLSSGKYSTAGSENSYKWHALSANSGIIDVAVIHAGSGAIEIYPLMADGSTTPTAVLNQVDAACNPEDVRPVSDSVTVIAPTAVAYDIDIEITPFDFADEATIETAANAALTAFTVGKRQSLGQDIVISQLIAAVHQSSPGQIFKVDVSDPGADVTVSATEYGNVGTIAVTINAGVPG